MMTTIPPSPTAATEAPRPERARKPSPTLPAFRAILHKMFFESLYLMIGAWVLLAVLIMAIVYAESDGFTHKIRYLYTLLEPGIIGLSIFCCAFLGFLLAFAQFRATGSRDQWALVVHRPIARSRLFGLMLLSGLTLLAICMGIPLVTFILWGFNTREAMPTFEVRFLFPYAAASLTGLATYSCGILLSQTMSRRLVTSFLALGNCGLAIAGAFTAAFVSHVMILEMVLISCNLLAAWGAFVTQGEPQKDTPKLARAGRLGTFVALCLLSAMIINPVVTAHFSTRVEVVTRNIPGASLGRQPLTAYASIQPLSDGHFGVVVRYYSDSFARIKLPPYEFYTLSGIPLPNASAPEFKMVTLREPEGDNTPKPQAGAYWNILDQVLGSGPPTPSNTLEQTYDHANIFSPTWLPKGEFEIARKLLPDGNNPPLWLIATNRHIYFSENPQAPAKIVLPLDPQSAGCPLYLSISSDRQLFFINYESLLDPMRPQGLLNWLGGQRQPEIAHLQSFDATGKLIDSITEDGTNPVMQKYESGSVRRIPPQLYPTIYLTGIGYSAGMSLAALPLQRWFAIPGYSDMPFWEPHIFFTALVCNALTAIVLILLARRYRLHRLTTAAWIPAGLLLGPLMILVFIGFHTRPVRKRCPSCRRPRPINETECPHCNAIFPAPAPTGTEIFATAAAAPS